jgi:hypothetical protein
MALAIETHGVQEFFELVDTQLNTHDSAIEDHIASLPKHISYENVSRDERKAARKIASKAHRAKKIAMRKFLNSFDLVDGVKLFKGPMHYNEWEQNRYDEGGNAIELIKAGMFHEAYEYIFTLTFHERVATQTVCAWLEKHRSSNSDDQELIRQCVFDLFGRNKVLGGYAGGYYNELINEFRSVNAA